ncbi:hypothetical protein HNR19_002499 [Nocardioides thalensis]|uniref:VWFD domain-containing protein n=1 Tax=Nocardioides thalensis TaxID=1914755 RepID=A0A853C3S0_9ACTN|nr:hypothetical protein [Nocardioides thalensis]NYJ01801.1 hypothetical protein [Nocardioides thalensis]
MLRNSPLRVLLAVVATTAAAVTTALPAQAAPPAPAAAPAAAVAAAAPNPNDGLDGAFGGQPSTLLRNALCPVGTGVADSIGDAPVVGPVASQLPAITCALNVAGFVWRSTYYPPSGPPVVRYTKATAGVPALIDVDGKGILPDFTGMLGVNLLAPGVWVQVSRNAYFPAANRVTLEAVLINPVAENSYIGFGPDGSTAGMGGMWKALLSVASIAADGADLGLKVTSANAPSSQGLIAEMFSGPDPDAPDDTYRGKLGFAPVPPEFNTRLRLADGRQQVTVNGQPTKLTGDVLIATPGREQNIDLVADQIPSFVDVVHDSDEQTGTDTTTYDANGSIARLTGTYTDTVDGDIETAAALDAWGIPSHLTFEQADEQTTVKTADDAKIDRIQARFARGSDVTPLVEDPAPFARFHRTTEEDFTASLQVSDLRSVRIDQGAPYGGRLVFATAPGLFPFTADDDVTSTHLEGHLSNLPADTEVSLDLDNGKVTFDGHGTGIDEIHLEATRPDPFFDRATRLEATLEDLPALEVIDVKQEDGTVTATASEPLGALTLLASNGPGAPAMTGSAVSYDDTPALYRAFLRISGLKEVSFQADPVVATLKTAQPQFLTVRGDAGGVTFDGTIDSLPAHLTFSLQPGPNAETVVDFDSHGQEIEEIVATGSGLPAPAGMPNFEAVIEHLPSHLTLTLPKNDGNVVFDAHGDHIGRVYAQAYGGSPRAVDPARQLLAYSEGQHIAANLLQIGNAEVSKAAKPFRLKYDIAAVPLDFVVNVPDTSLRGTVANPQPATVVFHPRDKDVDGEGGLTATYNVDPANHTGDGSIDSISVTGVIGGAFLEADLQNVPANLDLCLQTAKGTLCRPSWVPGTATGRTVHDPDFAVHFFPTNLNGTVPATPLVVNGIACTDVADEGACKDLGSNRKRIVIDNLAFKTVEAAFSSIDEGCDVACGAVWAGANTHGPGSPPEGDHITGRVRYFNGDGDIFPEPLMDLRLNAPDDFVALNQLFFYLHYDVISLDPLDYTSSGSLTCGDSPNLEIAINNLPNPDVLDGTFGVC